MADVMDGRHGQEDALEFERLVHRAPAQNKGTFSSSRTATCNALLVTACYSRT